VTFGAGPELVVIGAHYDAARLPDGSLSRGAVDNAASSVMLVRVAEALRAEKLAVRAASLY
jgi:Zn-dependent M28 family amino/carboxypeptidase